MDRIVLAAPEEPRASVVIPAWRRDGLLRSCLASLARHTSDFAFETVVLLNGATPDVTSFVTDEVEGPRVVSSRVNLGFGRGCNRAARAARGEFLVFLNDDAEVQDGWLDALVETADAHPEAGAVGSRIVSHDGLLLEAGGLVWREGVSSHLGRGWDLASGRHRYLRRADYCSASSLLVRRTTFDAVGGFDERYFPGYYEDVDLCLSIAGLGQGILYQPRSCVRHYESGSLEWDSPYKHFVSERSRRLFVDKWRTELERFPALLRTDDLWARDIVDERAVVTARHAHRRVLVVDGAGRLPAEDSPMATAVVALADRHTTVSAFVSDPPGDDRFFSDLGVEVFEGDLGHHLGRPTVLYDAVVLLRTADFAAWAPAVRALQPYAALLYDSADAPADVLGLTAAAASPAGSPLTGADRVVCHSPFDASLLAMVPGVAPLSLVGGQAEEPGAPPPTRPQESWSDAVTAARRDTIRKRERARQLDGRPR